MYNIQREIPINIVHYYLNNDTSLRKTAQIYNIHYQTLFKWLKIYKNQGEERLLSNYKRPWNRAKKEFEEKVVLLKERNPCLTVRKAKEILKKDGIEVSIKGIWGIWKRYGYAGFIKEKMGAVFSDCFSWTKEATKKFKQAEEIYNLGNIKESARILNSIPVFPKNELILKIPDCYLNLRRRVEKMITLYGKIPYRSYLKKMRNMYEECKKENLYYSALRLGIFEVMALSWSATPLKCLKRTEELKNILVRTGGQFSRQPFRLQFSLLILEGIACVHLAKIKRATEIAKSCCRLLKKRKYPSSHFMINIGILNTYLDNFREAEYWYMKSLEKATSEELKYGAKYCLSNVFFYKGEYKKAIQILKESKLKIWALRSKILLYQSQQSLVNGMPHKAISLSVKTLSILKKEEIRLLIFSTYLKMAASYCSLGEKQRAERILRRLVPFLKKNKLKRETTILRTIISPPKNLRRQILLTEDIYPTVKLALMLKNGNYWRAFKYADKRGIVADFHKYVFFFPKAVTDIIEKGKSTGLPKRMLKLPVFNKEIRVYYPKILGDLIIYKNQRYLRVKLQPKDTAFLIHLALKAGEPEEEIPLESLYNNFWKKSKYPARNLSHLLVRLKKNLKIPSHLLEVSYKRDNPVLINKGIHFITDYGEYQESIAQAKAYQRAGEWGFAEGEYLRAFSLFRGEPFKKMYDDWSDDKRLEIIFSYEKEVLSFTKELISRGRREEAKKLLKKAEKIVSLERDESFVKL